MTKHFLVKEVSEDKFVEEMNRISSENNIFASQTHVILNPPGNCLVYVAVMFGKD